MTNQFDMDYSASIPVTGGQGYCRLIMDKAIKALREGKDLTGKDGVLTPLIKQLTEAALADELDQHPSEDVGQNLRNSKTSKKIKTGSGSFEVDTPRDRADSFEPQQIKKNQTKFTDEIDNKILSIFARGMSYRDMRGHVEDMYVLMSQMLPLAA